MGDNNKERPAESRKRIIIEGRICPVCKPLPLIFYEKESSDEELIFRCCCCKIKALIAPGPKKPVFSFLDLIFLLEFLGKGSKMKQ